MISTLFIIVFLITIIAFVISVPINGYLTGLLINHGAYDSYYSDTQEVDTFWDYFDLVGSFCFFFLSFGWGNILSVEQDYITGAHRTLRLVLAYCAQAIVSLVIAICSIIPSVLLTGKSCIYTALNMFFVNSLYNATSDVPWQIFQHGSNHFATCSPYAITATLFFIAVVYVQTGILCISMVRNTFQAALYPFRFRLIASNYSWLFMIAIPLLFCIFFYKFFFALAITFIIFFINLISSVLTGA